jgi:AmmeMemoRadiSam system protein A
MSDTEALDPEAQQALLTLARRAIHEHLTRGKIPVDDPEEETLHQELAAFVTLEIDGKLRGCIGQPDASGPLHETVAQMAVAAATEDPHFSALELSDIRYTEIEISVLSPHFAIDESEIEVGTHGLYLAAGPRRAIILPQVAADQKWKVKHFLQELTAKAGLKRRAWTDPRVSLRGFTAQVFRDSDFL